MKQQGFTLVETIIVLSILGILAGIIYPGYAGHVKRAHRTDAKTVLLQAAARQERFFGNQNRYAGNMTLLGYSTDPLTTEDGRYAVSVNASTVNTYTLQAVPNTLGRQNTDGCGSFVIDYLGIRNIKNQPAGTSVTVKDCWH